MNISVYIKDKKHYFANANRQINEGRLIITRDGDVEAVFNKWDFYTISKEPSASAGWWSDAGLYPA